MLSYQQSFLMNLQTPFSSSWLRPTWFTAPAAKNHICLAWMEKRNVERFLKAVSRWNRYHKPLICENEAAKIRPSCQSLWCHCWQPKHSVLLTLSFVMLPHAHQCQVYNWFQCYKYIYKVSTLSLHYTYLTLPQYVYKGTDCAISSSAVPLHPLWSRAPFIGHICTGYGPCLRLIFIFAVLLAASFTLCHLRPSHTPSTHLHHPVLLHSFPLDPFSEITPFFATSSHPLSTPCPLRETCQPPLFQLSKAKTIVYGLMIWRPSFSWRLISDSEKKPAGKPKSSGLQGHCHHCCCAPRWW